VPTEQGLGLDEKAPLGVRRGGTGSARRALLGPLVEEQGGRPAGATPKPRGGASRLRWPAPLGAPGGAGPVGADERKPCRGSRGPHPIFAISIMPTKVLLNGMDGVVGTHTSLFARLGPGALPCPALEGDNQPVQVPEAFGR
jgi:hypothetical protein